jgi:hypothetical protein
MAGFMTLLGRVAIACPGCVKGYKEEFVYWIPACAGMTVMICQE